MIVFVLLSIFLPIALPFPDTLAFYTYERILKDGVIRLSWNYTKTNITGELHAKTQGWVGFGLSPNGGMDGSDVFVAKIVNTATGEVSFTDRHIVGTFVLVDTQQDWKLLGSSIRNGFLIVQFTRDIDTCDVQDRKIDAGAPRVIFAWNDVVASNSDIEYHGAYNYGTLVVQLLGALNERLSITAEDAIETYAFSVDVTLPPWETYYHCHMFKIPDTLINNKRHLLRTITKLTPGNENYVHHWFAYQCSSLFENSYLSNKGMPLPGHCFDYESTNSNNPKNTWSFAKGFCEQISLVWAIGGELVVDFPNGLGFPVGGSDREFTYFYLEIHYNNPEKRSGIVDQTSIQWNVTPRLRSTEIGIFANGALSEWKAMIIPPGQAAHKMRYYCTNYCLNDFTLGENITVFAAAPHTHTTGSAVVTTLIRNGTEIAYIDKSLNFDFNHQYINFLQEPVIIMPGDEIQTTCIYKTTGRNSYTFGGVGIAQEMCLDFLFYYPRRRHSGYCLSSTDNFVGFYETLYESDSLTFSKYPPNYGSFAQDLKSLKTDLTTINIVKTFFETTQQTQFCFANDLYTATLNSRVNPTAIVEKYKCSFSTKLNSQIHILIIQNILFCLFK